MLDQISELFGLIVLVLAAATVWWAVAQGKVRVRTVASVIGVGLLGMLVFAQRKTAHVASVTIDKDSVKYDRSIAVQSRSDSTPVSVKSPSRIELIPTPSDHPQSTASEGEKAAAEDPAAPDWLSLAETAESGDSPSVVSTGPHPSEADCRIESHGKIVQHVVQYARAHGMSALARRPELLTDSILQSIVRDDYVANSPQTFSGEQQTWYILYQLLEFDDARQQLEKLNDRAVADERLVVLGASSVGVLGLLSLAFVVLKTTERRKQRPSAAATSMEWMLK
jgi:hypothetical protein